MSASGIVTGIRFGQRNGDRIRLLFRVPAAPETLDGLGGYLRERGVDSLFCCGLARDVCVRWTARDAAEEGFSTHFIWDLTRPVDPANDDELRTELESKGVKIIAADQVRCHPDHADSRR